MLDDIDGEGIDVTTPDEPSGLDDEPSPEAPEPAEPAAPDEPSTPQPTEPAPPSFTPEPEQPSPGELTSESKNWAVGAHLSTLAGLIVPFGNIIGPLVVWLIKREDDPFIERHAREALNFNISITIYGLALIIGGFVLLVVLIGIFLFIAAGLLFFIWIILVIIAATTAARGDEYQYPLTLRLVQ